MLVLGRKQGERLRIVVGREIIWVTPVDIQRGKVRLGIEADKSVQVSREELLGDADKHDPVNRAKTRDELLHTEAVK